VMADQLLHELGIKEGVTLELNTLGDAASRDAWRAALITYFNDHKDVLSEDSLSRLDKNPLRILDSKDPDDRGVAHAAPKIDEFLSGEAQDFFGAVTAGLDAAGVAWTRNAKLVRGLDYYRHTAFEFTTDRLGAQGTVLGGGRYDGLIENLGGPATPAVGWAAGIERLAMLAEKPDVELPCAVVIFDSPEVANKAQFIAAKLRRLNISTGQIFKGSVGKQFEKARKLGPWVIVDVRFSSENWTRIRVAELFPDVLNDPDLSDAPKIVDFVRSLEGAKPVSDMGNEFSVPNASLTSKFTV
jgi:histidyl-tRNA synthetase